MITSDYETFREKDGDTLRCAVRRTETLPDFLGKSVWEWNGTLRRGKPAPSGFNVERAAYFSALSGFYFYHGLPG